MNTYFIGIAAILTVKWYYDTKKNDMKDNTVHIKKLENNLHCSLTGSSSDNLHKKGWNDDNCSQSQDKW